MYGYSTSQFVESENARLGPVRHEAPLHAIHKTALLMCQEANKARETAFILKADKNLLTPFAEDMFQKQMQHASACTVQRVDENLALVKSTEGTQTFERTVDFENKTCTCSEWQQTGRPCRHAIAFARVYYGRREFENNPKQFISFAWDPCYLAENYIKAVENVKVLPPNLEDLVCDGFTKPPKFVRAAGRPRRKRIRCAADYNGISRATGRPAKKMKCSRCGKEGHYVSTCTAAPNYEKIVRTSHNVPN